MSAKLAWSSGPGSGGPSGAACKRCSRVPCVCEQAAVRRPEQHDVRVQLERAGRRGKTVTVAGPLFLARQHAEDLLAALKRSCGCGGTLRLDAAESSAWIELQGDRAKPVVERLSREGFPVRRAGG